MDIFTQVMLVFPVGYVFIQVCICHSKYVCTYVCVFLHIFACVHVVSCFDICVRAYG